MEALWLSLKAWHVGQGCLDTDCVAHFFQCVCFLPLSNWNSATRLLPLALKNIYIFCSLLSWFHARFINASPLILTSEWPRLCKCLRSLLSGITTLSMEKHITNAAPCQCSLIICRKKSFFFFSFPEYDCLCCGEFAWRGQADSLAEVLANNLEAIFTPKSCLTWCNINVILHCHPLLSLHLTSSLERFAVLLRQTSKLFHFCRFVALGCSGLRSQFLFLSPSFFFFFGSFSHSLSSPYPSFYRGVVLSPALFQPSLQNAYDWRFQVRYHCTQDFQKWSFCITVRHRHMFKDIFAEFPSHLIPMDLHACALISWLTRESVECVGVKWRHLWRLNKHCTCHKGRHLGYFTVLLTVYVSIADWASLLKHVEEKAFFIIDTSIFITQ